MLCMLGLGLLMGGQAHAQYVNDPVPQTDHTHLYAPNLDTDFAQIRDNAFPDLRFRADDWLQYSPGLVMLGMKACGYESMSSWGRLITADAFSAAFMVAGVTGLKYAVRRPRPDGSSDDSFPSGHAAKVFTLATMMHLEYGGRSPWFSIGAYTMASSVALMRVMNNRHWLSDTFAGALIGIGATHLGYFVADKIFGDRLIEPGYAHPEFFYDETKKEYDVDLLFYRRFVLGTQDQKEKGLLPERGSGLSLDVSVPIVPQAGVTVRTGLGSLTSQNVCNALAGGFWKGNLNDRFLYGAHVMAGYAYVTAGHTSHLDVLAGTSIGLRLSNHFRLKAFAEYEHLSDFRTSPSLNFINLGFSAGFYW